MSKLFSIRQFLKDSIEGQGIFRADEILIKRQTADIWNDIATAMSAAQNDVVLHIGVAAGSSTEDEDLEMEITIPITIIAAPELVEGKVPEEDLWELMVRWVHDLKISPDHGEAYRFRFKSFSDIDVEADDGTPYLGRQTVFAYKLSLPTLPKP